FLVLPPTTLFPYTTLFRSLYDLIMTGPSNGSALFSLGLHPFPGGRKPLRENCWAEGCKEQQSLKQLSHPPTAQHLFRRTPTRLTDRKSTRLNSSHEWISYA